MALGAFLAGSLVAESGEEKAIERLVMPVRDVFAAIFFVLSLVFVYRSFYSMRIEEGENDRPASDEEDEEDEEEAWRAQEA